MTNVPQTALRGQSRDHDGKAATTFGGIGRSAVRRTTSEPDFTAIQQSPKFRDLRRRVNSFVFPMTALFLLWYIGYVVLAAYGREFMAQPVFGEINIGLVLGVLQFVTTVGITALYARYAARKIDPQVDEIRRDAEGGDQ
jgi:uncharacterized membrane protein (DUF485 family)